MTKETEAQRTKRLVIEATRSSYHQCLIGYEVAMFRLMMVGLTPAAADDALFAMPEGV